MKMTLRELLEDPDKWKALMKSDPGQKISITMTLDEWNTIYKLIQKWKEGW